MSESERHSQSKITEAAAAVFAEEGYSEATVAEIAARAEISVGRFHELFPDKEAALLALLESVEVDLFERARDGCSDAGEAPGERVESTLRALLSWVDERPPVARACLLETNRATPAVFDRRVQILDRLAALLRANHPSLPEAPAMYEELLVGGICEVLSMKVVGNEELSAVDLAPELAQLLRM
jgi:AcrR family transcriptional regulator